MCVCVCVCVCVCCVCVHVVHSVVHSDVAEQVGHGLPVVDASDGLGQNHADVHRLDLGALQLLHLVRNRVGHHHLGAPKDTQCGETDTLVARTKDRMPIGKLF